MADTLDERRAFNRNVNDQHWISRLQLQTRLCCGYRQIKRLTEREDFPKPHVVPELGTRWLIREVEAWERDL